jgi:hypothetical protein
MAEIIIRLSEIEKKEFEQKVGKGNMSSAIRQYIKNVATSQDNYRESTLRKKLSYLEDEKKKLDVEYIKIKTKVDDIDEKRKLDEIAKLEAAEKRKKKINDIEGRTMKTYMSEMV